MAAVPFVPVNKSASSPSYKRGSTPALTDVSHQQTKGKDRRHHWRRNWHRPRCGKRFIEEGVFVFIFGRRQDALDAALAELGHHACAVRGSVSDEADLDRLYAAVKGERGTLDIVLANTGVEGQLRLGEITAKHIDETFDINVKGTIVTVQKALPLTGY